MSSSDEDKDNTITTADEVANLRRWARALVSGEYLQGANCLIRKESDSGDKSYCCIGVAATIFDAKLRTDKLTKLQNTRTIWFSNDEDSPSTQVPEVKRACGLDGADLNYLAQMNDAEHASFGDIAQVLEEWAAKKEREADREEQALRHDGLGNALEELSSTLGPVNQDMLAEAKQLFEDGEEAEQ